MMRIGPFIVVMREKKLPADRIMRATVRHHIQHVLTEDTEIRAMIARAARSVAKDYIEEQHEGTQQ